MKPHYVNEDMISKTNAYKVLFKWKVVLSTTKYFQCR